MWQDADVSEGLSVSVSLGWEPVTGFCVYGNEVSGFMIAGHCLDWLNNDLTAQERSCTAELQIAQG